MLTLDTMEKVHWQEWEQGIGPETFSVYTSEDGGLEESPSSGDDRDRW